MSIEATVLHETLPPLSLKFAADDSEPASDTIAQAEDTTPGDDISATDELVTFIAYDKAVAEGKKIFADADRGWFRLGELADNIEPKYGDRTIAKFADAIGIAKCTVERYRTVYHKWKDILAPGPKLDLPYAVMRELANHPDPAQVIRENPRITKREAREIMRPYRADKKAKCGTKADQADEGEENEWTKHNRRWFKNLVTLAYDAASAADEMLNAPPEKQREMLNDIDPRLGFYLRGNGSTLGRLADLLDAYEKKAEAERRATQTECDAEAQEADAAATKEDPEGSLLQAAE